MELAAAALNIVVFSVDVFGGVAMNGFISLIGANGMSITTWLGGGVS